MTASVRTVSCTVAASLGLHGLLLLLAAWLITVLPVWERNRTSVAALPALTAAMSSGETEPELQEVAVSFLSLEPGPEKPVPPPPPVTSSAPPPSGTMTVRPREDQPALAPFNQNTPFISSQNMRAAATTAPTPGADPNRFNQDGHKISGLSLTTTDFIPGSEAQPPADSRPPEPPPPPPDSPDPVIVEKSQPPPPAKNERPPEPSATVKTDDPLAPAPTPKPAETLAMRETTPESLTLTKTAGAPARPKTPPARPPDPVRGKPSRAQVSRSPVLSSVKTKSAGALSIRGDESSVDALDTPEGRYNNAVYEQVGLLWNSRLATVRGLAGLGTVEVEFDIDPRGRVSNVKLVDPGKANPVLEDVCLTSIIKAKLPPPPAEMQKELGDPLSGGKLRRKFTFHRL